MKAWGLRGHRAALAVCCLFAVSGEAWAADLYVKPGLKDGPYPYIAAPALWEGFYVGGHVGGGWNTATVDDHYDYYGDPESRNDVNGSGIIGGGQIGYNFQWGNIVFGPEVDLGYLGLSGSRSVELKPSCSDDVCKLNANYSNSGDLYGDITGRLGYTFDQVLFYAKGGVAFLNTDNKANYVGQNCSTTAYQCAPANPSRFNFEQSDTLWGWTVGAGVEYALSQEWSVKVEYQHFDFGSTSFSHNGDYNFAPGFPPSDLKGRAEVSHTVDAIKVGVNFHFNSALNLE